MDKEEFDDRCRRFKSLLDKSKKDISIAERLGAELIRPIEQEVNVTLEVECKAGCNYCCSLRIEVLGFELVAIWLFINRTKNREEVKAIKEKIASQYNLVHHLSAEEHFKTNMQCPLLEDDRCSVYPVRPLSCAGHHSCSVASCKKSFENPHVTETEAGGIPSAMNIKQVQFIQLSVARQVMLASNHDETHHELISGLYHVSRTPSSIQRWKSGRQLIKS